MKLAFFGSDSKADGATNTIDTTSNNQELEWESISPEEAEVTVNELLILYLVKGQFSLKVKRGLI